MSNTSITRFWLLAGLSFILMQWILIAWTWNDLGESIPNHFDSQGNPDGWGTKYSLYLISLVSILMFFFLNWLARNASQFNGLAKINPEHKELQKELGRQFVMALNAGIAFLFLYILYSMIQAAQSGTSDSTATALAILLVCIGGPTLIYTIQSRRLKA